MHTNKTVAEVETEVSEKPEAAPGNGERRTLLKAAVLATAAPLIIIRRKSGAQVPPPPPPLPALLPPFNGVPLSPPPPPQALSSIAPTAPATARRATRKIADRFIATPSWDRGPVSLVAPATSSDVIRKPTRAEL